MKLFQPLAVLALSSVQATTGQTQPPQIDKLDFDDLGQLVVIATVPPGYRHAVLETTSGKAALSWEASIAGPLDGDAAKLTFRLPDPGRFALLRVKIGAAETLPPATHSGEAFFASESILGGDDGSGDGGDGDGGDGGGGEGGGNDSNPAPASTSEKIGHLLNRIAYGPSTSDYAEVQSAGIAGYIESQLHSGEETSPQLASRMAPLFRETNPWEEVPLVSPSDVWRFFRGRQAPPVDWHATAFDDTSWESGPSGIGYGDEDDATVLGDMRQSETSDGYLTVFCRKTFTVDDPARIHPLRLRIFYDDGFVAYLNGTEVARSNVSGVPPAYDTPADRAAGNIDNDDETAEISLTAFNQLLRAGENVLAIQVHNRSLDSSDLSMIPTLYHAPPPSHPTIHGIRSLQELVHLRGVYADNQLQAILGEFWENHFTTDYNKLIDYFDDLSAYEQAAQSEASEDRIERQIAWESAQLEFTEFEFFHEHALGDFGDLLLYSATSPAMLIYLDNVLNLKHAPNENYAREILELYALGADNRYTQTDIEQLARCFTGWSVRKTQPERVKPFPESARLPFITPSLTVEEQTVLLDLGPGWRYFKGRSEPTPDENGNPTLAWTDPDYASGAWTAASAGIGYGDGDDATVLDDMRDDYLTVYARREFTLDTNLDYDDLVLEVDYDDGFVAYLNGVEIGRSSSMRDYGDPPPFDRESRSHEASEGPDLITLVPHLSLIRRAPETNVLAIQVHNTSPGSSDLTMRPRILARRYTEDSVAPASPNGWWTFRFDPDEHDLGEKVLYAGTPHELRLPGNRTGMNGVLDAIDVIDAMVSHPSTSEFISIKLINRFVSDGISLTTYHDQTAPEELIQLVDEVIAAWNSTNPPGNIATVMRAILDPATRSSAFWSGRAYRSKIKSAVEYINSAIRSLDADITGGLLPDANERMGMTIFERETPDGFPEAGLGWMDTQSLMERMKFSQALAANLEDSGTQWNVDAFLSQKNIDSPESLIEYFDAFFFQNHLSADARIVLLDFANRDDASESSPFQSLSGSARRARLRELTSLLLSSPDFQLQ